MQRQQQNVTPAVAYRTLFPMQNDLLPESSDNLTARGNPPRSRRVLTPDLAPPAPCGLETLLLEPPHPLDPHSALLQYLHPLALDEIERFLHTQVHPPHLGSDELQRAARPAGRADRAWLHRRITVRPSQDVLYRRQSNRGLDRLIRRRAHDRRHAVRGRHRRSDRGRGHGTVRADTARAACGACRRMPVLSREALGQLRVSRPEVGERVGLGMRVAGYLPAPPVRKDQTCRVGVARWEGREVRPERAEVFGCIR